jgi:putative heme-binding domain-containing protein
LKAVGADDQFCYILGTFHDELGGLDVVICIRSLVTVAWLTGVVGGLLGAQNLPPVNPFEGEPDAVLTGMGLYRLNCADCHGVDARGVRGPDLSEVWASGRSDAGLFRTIRNGISGTEMRPFTGPRAPRDDEIWKILAYLRTLATPTLTQSPTGDASNGERIFRQNCSGCHRVRAVGGRLGPDLSRIGSSRSPATLVSRIREGYRGQSDSGYAPVTLTTEGGESMQGVTKNEDLFSIQIMAVEGRIQGFEKESLEALEKPTDSLMPVFGPDRLSDGELDDLVSYLVTLGGFDPAVP